MDFLDKVFEKVPYDRVIPIPTWQRFAALAGVVALILALAYFLVLKGQDEQISKLENDLADIEIKVENTKSQVTPQKLKRLEEKLAKLEADLGEAKKELPSQKEIPELLEQVSNTGTQSGLEFVVFKPLGEARKDYYAEVPVQLEINGKFHNVLMFFDEVAQLPRIVSIKDVRVKSGSKAAGVTNLSVKCKAVTYRFLESSVPADKKKKSAKGKKGKRK